MKSALGLLLLTLSIAVAETTCPAIEAVPLKTSSSHTEAGNVTDIQLEDIELQTFSGIQGQEKLVYAGQIKSESSAYHGYSAIALLDMTTGSLDFAKAILEDSNVHAIAEIHEHSKTKFLVILSHQVT